MPPLRGARVPGAMALLLAASLAMLPGAEAWWDNGHMLVAQVASLDLEPKEAERLDALLSAWAPDFPNSSDVVNAAVWPDVIKRWWPDAGARPDALDAFNAWHYTNYPWNPDGLKLAADLQAPDKQPSVTWALSQAAFTFKHSETPFAFNFMLRYMLHLVGDVHQPLHARTGYFDDKRHGHLPHGDRGGNDFKIEAPAGVDVSNLHALWDAAAGLYLHKWPFSGEEMEELRRNATRLTQALPRSSFPEYDVSEVAECFGTGTCGAVFGRWANESAQLAAREAYGHGVTYGARPSAEYVANVRNISQHRLTLAGYRLADVLRAMVLPPQSPAELAVQLSAAAARRPRAARPSFVLTRRLFTASCGLLVVTAVVLVVGLRRISAKQAALLQERERLLNADAF